ncbi:AraC family transcriptional regulator [Aquimarina sp. D1M17]|uniref:AraC family transcriptional regulator n=1 Tax=Aquimarina acroporae TaxID=2937283 RepID=UPI0020C04F93|nr:GyrI-like domain-containing protein [Aquimarina acroporae]MCK8524129.1 AraC family transcriptional regulator [Aquimarina acroporae]
MIQEHASRINNALLYIEDNLDSELSLDTIAKVAHYSPFHFHRIFKTITNEPLQVYINRKRLEKTAALLFRKKETPISEIYTKYGFNSNSSFTRAFKKFYGISPSEFRNISPSRYSKICKLNSKNGQITQVFEEYICNINNLKNWIQMNAKIEIKNMPEQDVAYITHIGVKDLGSTFYKLVQWSRQKGLYEQPDFKMGTIYHDSFKITSLDKIRMSACVLLDAPITTEGEIGLTSIAAGRHIVAHFEITPEDFEKSWSSLFVWMNEQGYKKDDKNPFEIYYNDFNTHPEKKCIVDFCIPIE